MSSPDPQAGLAAARLLAAAQEWLRSTAPHLAPTGPDGEPCSCPVCRAVAGVREADPDAVGRWVDTAVATLGTWRDQVEDLLATFAADDGGASSEGEAPVEEPPALATAASAGSSDPHGPAEPDDTSAGQHPREEPARQDGPGSRAVRRIPITRDEGAREP